MTNQIKIYFLTAILIVFSSSFIQAQNVFIPDANFKNALLENEEINTNGDEEIQVSEAQAFSGEILIGRRKIASLVGIEAFTALTYLYCDNNSLTSLDMSANKVLTKLSCQSNQLKGLNVSANKALISLYCYDNQLTNLDVSNNSALTELYCSTNQIANLDLSNNNVLVELDCSSNSLTSLNIKNGNNENIEDDNFNATNNPKLRHIKVDDPAWSTANWSQKDATATYVE